MQEIITLNGKKYVEYIEPEKKEYKRWRVGYNEKYFSINFYWEPVRYVDTNSDLDNYLYSEWRYFETEKEAIKESDKRLALVRVNDAILSLNEWWKEDWNNRGQEKWWIAYNNDNKFFESGFNTYFIEWNLLLKIKSEEIAKKIIEEHEEDLKLIFDI